jgi:hypothetical protein
VTTGTHALIVSLIKREERNSLTRTPLPTLREYVAKVDHPPLSNVNSMLDIPASIFGQTEKLTESNHTELMRLQQLASEFHCNLIFERLSYTVDRDRTYRIFLKFPDHAQKSGDLWSGAQEKDLPRIFKLIDIALNEYADTITQPYTR